MIMVRELAVLFKKTEAKVFKLAQDFYRKKE